MKLKLSILILAMGAGLAAEWCFFAVPKRAPSPVIELLYDPCLVGGGTNVTPVTAIIFPKLSQHVERWPRALVITIDLVLVGLGLSMTVACRNDPSIPNAIFLLGIALIIVGYWFVFSTPF